MLGLQSRHLKAALSGAGMQVAPATPSSPSLASPVSALPAPNMTTWSSTGTGPSTSTARAPRGRGAGEKRSQEQSNDGIPKESSGGRAGGKDKSRSRHASGPRHGVGGKTPDATPRILSRQDPPPSSFTSTEAPPKDRTSPSGSQDPGSGRGRGSRRGRGQP